MTSTVCRTYHTLVRPYVHLVGGSVDSGRRIVSCRGKGRGLAELLDIENEDGYECLTVQMQAWNGYFLSCPSQCTQRAASLLISTVGKQQALLGPAVGCAIGERMRFLRFALCAGMHDKS